MVIVQLCNNMLRLLKLFKEIYNALLNLPEQLSFQFVVNHSIIRSVWTATLTCGYTLKIKRLHTTKSFRIIALTHSARVPEMYEWMNADSHDTAHYRPPTYMPITTHAIANCTGITVHDIVNTIFKPRTKCTTNRTHSFIGAKRYQWPNMAIQQSTIAKTYLNGIRPIFQTTANSTLQNPNSHLHSKLLHPFKLIGIHVSVN